MKRYVVLLAYRPEVWEAAAAGNGQEYFDAHHAFERFVDARGARLHSGALCEAETATTLGPGRGAERVVTDGPFVELIEQLGGYYDIQLPDLDTAIAAGRLLPAGYTVEIRPVVTIEGYEPA
ncbi:MAG: YciI family protein [Ornithinibacter sp.]